MKKSILFFAGVFALVMSSSFIEKPTKLLIGKWKLIDYTMPDITRTFLEMNAKIKSATDSILFYRQDSVKCNSFKSEKELMENVLESMNNSLADMKKNSYLEFSKKGKVISDLGGFRSEGEWKLMDENKKLIITNDSGKNDTLSISELTSEKLILEIPADTLVISFQKYREVKR